MSATAAPEMVDASRPEPDRDRYGRYMIPHPDTGVIHPWTRATTFASSIAETFALEQWKIRQALLGASRRPDVIAQAAGVMDPDDPDAKKLLNRLGQTAIEAAGASIKANLGSALHTFAELVDGGRDPQIPEQYRADIAAYCQAMAEGGYVIDRAHIERVVIVPGLSVAGTFDRLVTLPDGRLVVGDLKTGKDLSYSWTEIAIQLALYANATHIYDVASRQLQPMPEVDKVEAMVMHVPVGRGQCTLYMVDIAAGWEAASQLCGPVRTWRKRKDLATEVGPAVVAAKAVIDAIPGTVEVNEERSTWIAGRIELLATEGDPDKLRAIAAEWPQDCPPQGPWSNEQVDAIAHVLSPYEASFGDTDPAVLAKLDEQRAEQERNGGPYTLPPATEAEQVERCPSWNLRGAVAEVASEEQVTELLSYFQGLPEDRQFKVQRWCNDANTAGRQFHLNPITTDALAIMAAAIACAQWLWDDEWPEDLTRAALSIAADVEPELFARTWDTGAVLGSLSIAAARLLFEIAEAFNAGDKKITADLGRRQAAMDAASNDNKKGKK